MKRFAMIAACLALVPLSSTVARDAGDKPARQEQGMHRGGPGGFGRPDGPRPEVTATNLDNGVKLTVTSADPAVVERIRQRENDADRPGLAGVTRTVVEIDGGVEVTLTSDDAETVARLQQHAQRGPEGRRGEPGQRGQRGPRPDADRPAVDRVVSDLPNGVRIVLTSTNAEAVARLQAGPGDRQPPLPEGVTRTVTNLENGVAIELTTDDAEMVAKLREHAASQPRPGHGGHGGGRPGGPACPPAAD